jgi:hypothetical protein
VGFCQDVLAFADAHPRRIDDPLYEADWNVWQAEVRDRLAGGTTRHPLFAPGPDDGDPPVPLVSDGSIVSRARRWLAR